MLCTHCCLVCIVYTSSDYNSAKRTMFIGNYHDVVTSPDVTDVIITNYGCVQTYSWEKLSFQNLGASREHTLHCSV